MEKKLDGGNGGNGDSHEDTELKMEEIGKGENIKQIIDMSGGAVDDGQNYKVSSKRDPDDPIPPGSGDESILSERLLQILNNKINEIVLEFKLVLSKGTGKNVDVNQSVLDIVNVLGGLTTDITTSINNIKISKLVDIDINGNITKSNDINTGDFKGKITDIDTYLTNTDSSTTYKINDLNDNINTEIKNQIVKQANQADLNIPEHVDAVQKRINNCKNLEELYLIKHIELMKIFAFTINLFDKYKYSIKIMLFLLKFLVNKNKSADCGKITLPPVVIPNIINLLNDQKTVQDVITNMKDKLTNDNTISKLEQKFTINPQIEENLRETTIPSTAAADTI
jgi:hypothetical protein